MLDRGEKRNEKGLHKGLDGKKWAPPLGGRRGLASSRRPGKANPVLTGPIDRTVQANPSAWRLQLAADNAAARNISTPSTWPPEEWGDDRRRANGPEAEPEPSRIQSVPVQILVSGPGTSSTAARKNHRHLNEKDIRIKYDKEDVVWAPLAEQWARECEAYQATFLYKGGSATSSSASFTEKLEVNEKSTPETGETYS